MDYADIVYDLTKESERLEKLAINKRLLKQIPEYQFAQYKESINCFLLYLESNIVSHPHGAKGLLPFKSVLESLVENWKMPQSLLDILKEN